MSDMSNYLENKVIDVFFRNQSYTPAATVYVGLFTAVSDAEAGTGTEVSAGGYARQAITFGSPSNGVSSNSATVSWTASGGNFGTVTHFAVFDAVTTGNALTAIKTLSSSKVINDGDTATFAVSGLSLTAA